MWSAGMAAHSRAAGMVKFGRVSTTLATICLTWIVTVLLVCACELFESSEPPLTTIEIIEAPSLEKDGASYCVLFRAGLDRHPTHYSHSAFSVNSTSDAW